MLPFAIKGRQVVSIRSVLLSRWGWAATATTLPCLCRCRSPSVGDLCRPERWLPRPTCRPGWRSGSPEHHLRPTAVRADPLGERAPFFSPSALHSICFSLMPVQPVSSRHLLTGAAVPCRGVPCCVGASDGLRNLSVTSPATADATTAAVARPVTLTVHQPRALQALPCCKPQGRLHRLTSALTSLVRR